MKKLLAAFADAMVDVSETMTEAPEPARDRKRLLDHLGLANTLRDRVQRADQLR